jgi:Domain of unknown function (DUF4258)
VSGTLIKLQELALLRKVRVSDHGNEETQEDDMDPELLVQGIQKAILIEDYPDAFKGPSVLLLQDYAGVPVHVVWGLARVNPYTATLITAYFPDPEKWYDGFTTRKPK